MSDSHRMWAALEIEARERRASRPRPRFGWCLAWALVLFVATCWALL